MAEILSEQAMNMVEVKKEIEAIKKRDKELSFRSGKTEDYLNGVVKLSDKHAKELYDKVMSLNIPRLRDIHVHKIVDIMPKNTDEVNVMFQGYPITITQESAKKIVDVVKEFA